MKKKKDERKILQSILKNIFHLMASPKETLQIFCNAIKKNILRNRTH